MLALDVALVVLCWLLGYRVEVFWLWQDVERATPLHVFGLYPVFPAPGHRGPEQPTL